RQQGRPRQRSIVPETASPSAPVTKLPTHRGFMKYQKHCLLLFLSAVVMTGSEAAQQPTRIKRPVKNPPQFPNIIDLDNKDTTNRQANQQPAQQNKAEDGSEAQSPASLAGAIQSLSNELRALGQELRTQ